MLQTQKNKNNIDGEALTAFCDTKKALADLIKLFYISDGAHYKTTLCHILAWWEVGLIATPPATRHANTC